MSYDMQKCTDQPMVKNSVLYHFKVALLFVHASLSSGLAQSMMQVFSSVKKKGD